MGGKTLKKILIVMTVAPNLKNQDDSFRLHFPDLEQSAQTVSVLSLPPRPFFVLPREIFRAMREMHGDVLRRESNDFVVPT